MGTTVLEGGARPEVTRQTIDSVLGRWTHVEWRPGPGDALAWAVERVWDFEGWTTHARERVFPNGALEIIGHLGALYTTWEFGAPVVSPRLCVTGIQSGPMVIEAPPGPCVVMGIRLHAAGAWAVLREPLHGATDRTVDLRDVVGGAAEELGERCDGAVTAEARVRRAVGWVAHRVRRAALGPRCMRSDVDVAWAAERIRGARGVVSIGDLRARTGHSKAGFTAAFREQVGVTPKRYARIHRFHHALEWLHRSSSRLANVALSCGYYDQAHMNADFREFAGLTPAAFRRSTHYPNSPSLPE